MIKIGEYTHAGTPITRNNKNNGILLLLCFALASHYACILAK
jgi:hypothetical protein